MTISQWLVSNLNINILVTIEYLLLNHIIINDIYIPNYTITV